MVQQYWSASSYEPSWHRRQRAERSDARFINKLSSVGQTLQNHHGSTSWNWWQGQGGGDRRGGGGTRWTHEQWRQWEKNLQETKKKEEEAKKGGEAQQDTTADKQTIAEKENKEVPRGQKLMDCATQIKRLERQYDTAVWHLRRHEGRMKEAAAATERIAAELMEAERKIEEATAATPSAPNDDKKSLLMQLMDFDVSAASQNDLARWGFAIPTDNLDDLDEEAKSQAAEAQQAFLQTCQAQAKTFGGQWERAWKEVAEKNKTIAQGVKKRKIDAGGGAKEDEAKEEQKEKERLEKQKTAAEEEEAQAGKEPQSKTAEDKAKQEERKMEIRKEVAAKKLAAAKAEEGGQSTRA